MSEHWSLLEDEAIVADYFAMLSKELSGTPFSILSYETDGTERLIEVKTTRFGQFTPFFVSSNEVAVSDEQDVRYHLYRLFNFDVTPSVFSLRGSLNVAVDLEPIVFRANIS